MSRKSGELLKDPRLKGPGIIEMLAEALLGVSRPLDCVQIEVTSHCPGKCVYCPHTTAQNWQSRFLPDEAFARLWPVLRRSSRAHLQGWGEPLLHPRFFDYAALARRAGCQVSTTSCGLAVNDEVAEKIAASGMDMIAFSLVGTDAASNAPRHGVDFDGLVQAVRKVRGAIDRAGAGPELHFAYLLLADRMEAVESLPGLMAELGVGAAVVSTLDYLALPEHREWAFAPDEREKIARARELLQRAAEKAASLGVAVRYALPAAVPHGQCRENVGRTLYVDAGGEISPCVYLNVPDANAPRRLGFGNVMDRDAWQIWKQEDFGDFRARVGQPDCPVECRACPKRYEEEPI